MKTPGMSANAGFQPFNLGCQGTSSTPSLWATQRASVKR